MTKYAVWTNDPNALLEELSKVGEILLWGFGVAFRCHLACLLNWMSILFLRLTLPCHPWTAQLKDVNRWIASQSKAKEPFEELSWDAFGLLFRWQT